MQATDDCITGHIPDGLVHGPVASRRFGRSLGISCSPPGAVACRWRCPYCQLGAHAGDGRAPMAPVADIVAAVERSSARGSRVDAVTVAGSGEPLEHPDFDRVAAAAVAAARRLSARAVLLTNGDRLDRWRDAVAGFDLAYVKWDPGPRAGAWRPLAPAEVRRRRQALRGQPGLRIQSLLCGAAVDADPATLSAWLEDLRDLRPVEVHLTTLERPAPDPRLRPAPAARLEAWRSAAARVLGVPVRSFPASADAGTSS